MSSPSFREDWKVGTALLATLLGLGVIGAAVILLLGGAAPLPHPDTGKIKFSTTIGPLCTDDPAVREQVRTTVLAGLESALHQHVEKLMAVWISDGGVNPERAANGVWIGSRAYLFARKQIEEWDIPSCKR